MKVEDNEPDISFKRYPRMSSAFRSSKRGYSSGMRGLFKRHRSTESNEAAPNSIDIAVISNENAGFVSIID